jgi:hypothetical protein
LGERKTAPSPRLKAPVAAPIQRSSQQRAQRLGTSEASSVKNDSRKGGFDQNPKMKMSSKELSELDETRTRDESLRPGSKLLLPLLRFTVYFQNYVTTREGIIVSFI